MTWRDELRPASFRGVPFEVEDSDFAGGRRGELHEYPLRDRAYFEDLGLKAREFTITGFVVGADYLRKRDALIAALEAGGEGQLVHPFYGSRNVAVLPFRVRESKRDGGSATFTMSFVESGEPTQPISADDPTAQVLSASDAFDLAAIAGYAERFISEGFPEFVIATSKDIVGRSALSMLSNVTNPEFADKVSAFISDIPLLISSASAFASTYAGIMKDFRTSAESRGPVISSLLATSESDYLEPVPRETASRIQESESAKAMASLVRRVAISASARELTYAAFVSANDANAAMIEFADFVDSEVEREDVSDSEYSAARALTAKVVADLSTRLGGLPRVRNIELSETSPALVLAHDLYEDVARDSEIIDRNRILRPGFVPAGQPIEVLSE